MLSHGLRIALFLICCTSSAHAELLPPFTQNAVSLSAGLRYGSNDLNLGLGAHGGYTLEQRIYVGGAFDYWFGESEEVETFGGSVTAEASGWNVFGLVGYDFGLTEQLVIRPFGGGGIFRANAEACTIVPGAPVSQCVVASETQATGAVGGQLMVLLGGAHLGGEVRFIFAEETAAIIGANVGAVF
jgi:hypothetical protein